VSPESLRGNGQVRCGELQKRPVVSRFSPTGAWLQAAWVDGRQGAYSIVFVGRWGWEEGRLALWGRRRVARQIVMGSVLRPTVLRGGKRCYQNIRINSRMRT